MKNHGFLLGAIAALALLGGGGGLIGFKLYQKKVVEADVETCLRHLRVVYGDDPEGGLQCAFWDDEGALAALEGLGPDAIPPLCRMIESTADPDTLQSALVALGTLGPSAGERAPILIPIVRTRPFYQRCEALWALGKLGNSSPEVLDCLSEAVLDPNTGASQWPTAFESLIRLGPDSPQLARTLVAIDALTGETKHAEVLHGLRRRFRPQPGRSP